MYLTLLQHVFCAGYILLHCKTCCILRGITRTTSLCDFVMDPNTSACLNSGIAMFFSKLPGSNQGVKPEKWLGFLVRCFSGKRYLRLT